MRNILSKLHWGKTLIVFCLAAAMFRASAWQWERYGWKSELVASYKSNSGSAPLEFPAEDFTVSVPGQASVGALQPEDESLRKSLRYKKVRLRGKLDYSRQFIVTNKRDVSGPGHFLFAPLLLEGTDRAVLLSRGFIPFEDREPQSWQKWNAAHPEQVSEIDAVVQESIEPGLLSPANPEPTNPGEPVTLWYFEECGKIALQLPYPVIYAVYAQQLGEAAEGVFPKPSVTIQIPPSTHFGYAIEWALLGVLTIALGIGLQVVKIGTPRKPADTEMLEQNTIH